MRDEFPTRIKEELAKRVGFLCSNPACRQPTSGPQSEPSGSVNIGVAAHITAASPGGPRFNDELPSTERQSAINGIWLCQTCAKLIDSDISKYTKQKLFEWKRDSEMAAARALEKRRSPYNDSEGVFLEAEQLMPELIAEMREDVRKDDSELIRELVILTSRTVIFNSNKPRFYYFEKEHKNLRLKIDWLEEMGLISDVTVRKAPIYRMLPDFVEWLRGPI